MRQSLLLIIWEQRENGVYIDVREYTRRASYPSLRPSLAGETRWRSSGVKLEARTAVTSDFLVTRSCSCSLINSRIAFKTPPRSFSGILYQDTERWTRNRRVRRKLWHWAKFKENFMQGYGCYIQSPWESQERNELRAANFRSTSTGLWARDLLESSLS